MIYYVTSNSYGQIYGRLSGEDPSDYGDRLGVCFDTCHAFAAGYDIGTPGAYEKTFSDFERIIGIKRLRLFHLNDSRKGLGCRVDRHEHIGKGAIGLEAFRLLLNDPRFQQHPMVLETPKGKDLREDRKNLRVLRSLLYHPTRRYKKLIQIAAMRTANHPKA
jgi:deoxyribonuclease IV